MHRVKLLIAAIFITTFATPSAFAQGLTVVMSQTGAGPQPSQQTMQLTPTRGRFDVAGLGQVFYNSENKTMRVVPAPMKAYMEYTPDSVQKAVAAGRGVAASPRLAYRKTGASKVRNWPCTTYEGVRGTEKLVELCVAEGAGIALTAADFKIVQEAVDLAKSFAAQDTLDNIPTYGTVEKQGYAGFPVRRITFRNGQPATTTELTEIRREAIPAASLEVPAGFIKVGQ